MTITIHTKRLRQKFGLIGCTVLLLFVAIYVGHFYAQSPQASASKLGPGRQYSTIERLKPERLRAVNEDRIKYQRLRRTVPLQMGLGDVKAILHAHAEDSTHTGGTRAELLAAAKRTGVKVVMLTDHVRPPKDFIN